MAVARASDGDIEKVNSGAALFDAPDTAVDTTFDFGTGTNRVAAVVVTWNASGSHAFADNAVTIVGGDTFTPFGATVSQSNTRKRAYYLINPPTGSQTVRVQSNSGVANAPGIIEILSRVGAHQTTPPDGYTPATGEDTAQPWVSSVTITSETDDLVDVSHGVIGTGVGASAATNYTERKDTVTGSLASNCGEAAGAASVATSCSFPGVVGSGHWIALGWNWNAAAAAAAAHYDVTTLTISPTVG